MLERMTRGKFAKLLAAVPMVALALKSDGSRTAAAPSPTRCHFFEQSCSDEQGGICGKRCDWACGPTYKTYWTAYGCAACLDRVCD